MTRKELLKYYKRPEKVAISTIVIVVVGLFIWGLILSFGPSTSRIPPPQDLPSPASVTPQPRSQVTIGQVPTSEPEETVIYIVNKGISYRWGYLAVIKSWEKAKYTRLEIAGSCPRGKYCVIVKENPKINPLSAGETLFGNNWIITIDLNPAVRDVFEAQTTLCHEFGHVLGAPHITGTLNTCMTIKESYRNLPTALDLQTVDSLGPWELEKMYNLSGKTVDVRTQPK